MVHSCRDFSIAPACGQEMIAKSIVHKKLTKYADTNFNYML